MSAMAKKSGFAAALAVILAVAAYFVFVSNSSGSNATLITSTGRHPVDVEIANTPQSREIGLMNRDTLAADTGMLFDFGETRPVSMWMKNTLISLDMLFIDDSGKIVRVARNAHPLSLDIIPSGDPVRYVLELNGGAAAVYGVQPGDRLQHPIIDAKP